MNPASLIMMFGKFGKPYELGGIGSQQYSLRFGYWSRAAMQPLHSRHPFGYGAVCSGILVLWVLLAGDIAPTTIAAAAAVAIAATAWVRLIEP
jgi:hypothetical protein